LLDYYEYRFGDKPKYCRKACIPKRKWEGVEPDCDGCENSPPSLYNLHIPFLEIYSKCNNARDGMSGALDYGVALKIMELYKLNDEEQLDFIDKIMSVEDIRMDENKKKEVLKKAGSKKKILNKNKKGR